MKSLPLRWRCHTTGSTAAGPERTALAGEGPRLGAVVVRPGRRDLAVSSRDPVRSLWTLVQATSGRGPPSWADHLAAARGRRSLAVRATEEALALRGRGPESGVVGEPLRGTRPEASRARRSIGRRAVRKGLGHRGAGLRPPPRRSRCSAPRRVRCPGPTRHAGGHSVVGACVAVRPPCFQCLVQ